MNSHTAKLLSRYALAIGAKTRDGRRRVKAMWNDCPRPERAALRKKLETEIKKRSS
jgi:hypothetical protein